MNSDDNILYHYTSIEVLRCIFESYNKENPYLTFWATNCAYMNDPKEISEGIELVKQTLRSLLSKELIHKAKSLLEYPDTETLREYLFLGSTRGDSDIPYSISFSSNKDNLNMWRMYGDNGRGIALGFNRRKISSEDCKLIDCVYNEDGKNEDFKKGVIQEYLHLYKLLGDSPKSMSQDLYEEIMTMCRVPKYAVRVKNKNYSYEHETRLIKNCKDPNFRVSKGVLIPYTPIMLHSDALCKIVVGPNCDERNINSLKLFFLSKGIGELFNHITQSEVPYRN